MVRFKDWNDTLKANADPNKICPSDETHGGEIVEITAMMAYDDYLKFPKNRDGLLHCFCKDFDKNSTIEDAYEVLLEIDPELEPNPCIAWKSSYSISFYLIIISGALISAINGICVFVFEVIVAFEKKLTYMDETIAQFQRIVMIQYCMIALVLLFADFSLGYASSETGL